MTARLDDPTPDHLGFKAGDDVLVEANGYVFKKRIRGFEKYKDGRTYALFEGAGSGASVDCLRAVPKGTPPPSDDAWDPGAHAKDIPIVEGGGPNPLEEDPAAEFETAPLSPNKPANGQTKPDQDGAAAVPAPDHAAIRSHVGMLHTLAKRAGVEGILAVTS